MASRASERKPKKCPVCGHAPRVSTCGYWVACDGCYLMGPRGKTPAAAIAAWNRLSYRTKPAKGSCPWCLQPPAKSVGHPCVVTRDSAGWYFVLIEESRSILAAEDWHGPPLKPGESMDMLIVAAPKKKIDIPLRPLLQEVFARIDRKKRIRADVVAELQRRKLAAPKPAKPKRRKESK